MKKFILLSMFLTELLFFPANAASFDHSEPRLTHQRFCLSIDGGGLRGVVPATLLKGIEAESERPVSELFKAGITGTSTGALIALGLAARKNMAPDHADYNKPLFAAQDLVNFYFVHGNKIFGNETPQSCCGLCCMDESGITCLSALWNIITCCCCCYKCCGVCGPKYSNSYLKAQLELQFGDRRLSDVVVPVQVVAFDVTTNAPIYFSSHLTPNVRMVDAALASSAAPTYFAPHKFQVSPDDSTIYRCIDGGIYENNPVFSALRYAVELYRREYQGSSRFQEAEIKDFKVFSIGTGVVTQETISKYNHLSTAGKLGWAPEVIEMGMLGTSAAADHNMEMIFGRRQDGEHYYRLQINISKEEAEMDNPRVIESLSSKARQYVTTRRFLEIVNELKNSRLARQNNFFMVAPEALAEMMDVDEVQQREHSEVNEQDERTE